MQRYAKEMSSRRLVLIAAAQPVNLILPLMLSATPLGHVHMAAHKGAHLLADMTPSIAEAMAVLRPDWSGSR
jgi:hypothetical protein